MPRRGSVVAEGAVAVAPAAHHVEALQGEAGRVDLGVAGVAGLPGAVLGELLADGGRAADVGLDGRDARAAAGAAACRGSAP